MNPKEALDRLIGEPMMHLYAPDEPDFDTTIFQESVHPTAPGELADSEDRPQTPSQRCFGGGGVANAIWGIPDHFVSFITSLISKRLICHIYTQLYLRFIYLPYILYIYIIYNK